MSFELRVVGSHCIVRHNFAIHKFITARNSILFTHSSQFETQSYLYLQLALSALLKYDL